MDCTSKSAVIMTLDNSDALCAVRFSSETGFSAPLSEPRLSITSLIKPAVYEQDESDALTPSRSERIDINEIIFPK